MAFKKETLKKFTKLFSENVSNSLSHSSPGYKMYVYILNDILAKEIEQTIIN